MKQMNFGATAQLIDPFEEDRYSAALFDMGLVMQLLQ